MAQSHTDETADAKSDKERFIPDSAEKLTDTVFSSLWATDDGTMFSTGVTCQTCGCGVARVDGGTVECPGCDWSGETVV